MTPPSRTSAGVHAPSYYAASANAYRECPLLAGEVHADICIVGAGFTGLSAAMELTAKGFDVVILEGERVGWGASGRNGGQLINGYSRSLGVIGRRYGRATEDALAAMALEGASIIRHRIDENKIECDFVDGNLVAAFTAKQMREFEHEVANWRLHGHDGIHTVDRNSVQKMVRTDRYVGGMLDMLGGHFHPLNFALGEAAVVQSRGARIFERSRVIRLDRVDRHPVAVTPLGRVIAKTILLCGNAYLGDAAPGVSSRVMPVSSQIVATEPLGDLAIDLLPPNYCVEDANYILDYYRRTADNRILYGGGTVYGGQDVGSIAKKLRKSMLRTFPHLQSVKIDFAWSGNFALTLTRVPQIGRIAPDIYFSHGDSGHGVTTTQLLGRLLAEGVCQQMTRFDAFADLPYFAFPGGRRFRVPLTILGAWYYMLRDRLGL